jgi:hypothetical protein
MSKLKFIGNVCLIALAVFALKYFDAVLLEIGYSVFLIEMIALFINAYIKKLPNKLVHFIMDTGAAVPSLFFAAYFASINEIFSAIVFSLLAIAGIVSIVRS